MTDTTNGWPGKPGVPLNPEKDGDHWVKSALTGEIYLLKWKAEKFYSCGQPQILPHWVDHPMWQVKEMIYLGSCLTPDEATALQKRVAELEDFCEDYLVRFELFHITNTQDAPEDATGFLAEKARAILGAALTGGKDE